MKPIWMMLVFVLLSLCLTQQAWAGGDVHSNVDGNALSTRTMGNDGHLSAFHVAEWTDRNVHDPGITILEAFLRAAKRMYRAVIRFGDGIRGRIPAD